MWKREFKKEKTEIVSPKSIIQQQCTELSKLTNGFIIGRVVEYNGFTESGESLVGGSYSSSRLSLSPTIPQPFVVKRNIQDNLGEIERDIFSFEFFITSKETPKYKYRAFFIKYDIELYPVKITLDVDIANEINPVSDESQKNEIFIFNTQTEFINFLEKVLNSEKITNVINSLIAINSLKD